MNCLKSIGSMLMLSLVFSLSANRGYAQLAPIPPSNEQAVLVNSIVLDQPRSIWIHLPDTYAAGKQTYPVLYLLDGEGHFEYVSQLADYLSAYDRNMTPEMIVVGIVNINRGKDLTLVHPVVGGRKDPKSVSATEGAGRFLKFIQQELVPYIDSNYRTQPYRILMGHSMAGQFALYTKNLFPELFKSTILVSPAIHNDNENLIGDFGLLLQQYNKLSGKLFVTIGNENTQKVDLLLGQLKDHAPASFKWSYRQYKDENHFSVPYKSMFDALKFIYAGWAIDFYSNRKLFWKDIEQHFSQLSAEFGYAIKPDENFVNNCGYMQLRLKNIDGAIEIFMKNVNDYPESYNVYDSMGEAYMIKGEKELAIQNYEKSILLNPDNRSGKEMLKRLKQ